jgi:protocatechuate 3,4-dioxygenase beta subunit
MEHADLQRGRVLTRREALALLGASSAAILAGCKPAEEGVQAVASRGGGAVPWCVVRPEQTEGPYFVDGRRNRSDIRSDPATGVVKAGVPLQLAFNVSRVTGGGCSPLAGAQVDLWHCDALGVYSDVRDPGFDTVGQQFLRGYQVTDAAGAARFTTVYPGWYRGRTVHLHFKVRTDPAAARGYEFTSQLYFDDALTDRVHALEPYAGTGRRAVRNEGDRIFRDGGEQLILAVAEDGQGYAATFHLGLEMT